MDDIELMIKIPKKVYEAYKGRPPMLGDAGIDMIAQSIAKGTPLPKGHGRLIDYSWVVDNVIKKLGIKDKRYLLEAEKALMSIVEIAPTIIEADKESEDE